MNISEAFQTPIGRVPTSNVYGPDYPTGWLKHAQTQDFTMAKRPSTKESTKEHPNYGD